MTQDNSLDMLHLSDNKDPSVPNHSWSFNFEAELDAVKRYHTSQVELEKFTGHHLICYDDDKRTARITVRPFDAYEEKQNAFANMFMMVPVIAPTSVILFSDVWMRSIDLEKQSNSDTLDPTNDPMSKHFIPPSKSKDRQEAITVICMDKFGYSTTILPYKRHDGAVIWQDELSYHGSFVAFDTINCHEADKIEIEELISSSYLIRMMRDSLMTSKPDGVSQSTAFWMLENQGYEIKNYS